MPLPDGHQLADMEWPPRQLRNVMPKLNEWSAWYGGDPAALNAQYSRTTGNPAQPRVRPAQYQGGIVGGLARMFWGQPPTPGQQRTKLHVPVAGDIASASADLLFSEALSVTLKDGALSDQDRLQELLDGIKWDTLLPEQGELCAAYGGAYMRVVWDKDVEPHHPLPSIVRPSAAWPEFSYGRLRAVTFWAVIEQDDSNGRTIRLLERHERGRIEYGVYEGTTDKLGRRVDFGAAPDATDGLEVDDQSGIDTGWPDGLTAVYIPNRRPTLESWANDPLGSNLGSSDFAGVEPEFDAIDETMSSWMRDVRLGKARILVPDYMLQTAGPGQGALFNADQEVFTALSAMAPEDGNTVSQQLTPHQFEIRAQQHADTLKELLSIAYRRAGYSAQTFGIVEEGAPTATEVDARERRSYQTREKKSRLQTDGLQQFLRALVAIDSVQFQGGIGLDAAPRVEFPAASQPTLDEVAQSIQMLRAARAISVDTAVRMAHPDWSDDEQKVADEVARIIAEDVASRPTVAVQAPADLASAPGLAGQRPSSTADPQGSGSATPPDPAGNAAGGR